MQNRSQAKRPQRNLAYFENWVDPIALEILAKQPEIHLHRLRYADSLERNLSAMQAALGYQIAPRGELQRPWFADAQLLDQCRNLLAVTSTGSGYDMIDVEQCTKAGVIVCNQTGSNRVAVAEHTLGLMLALSHKLASADRAMRSVEGLNRFAYAGNDLQDKVAGIVGLGQIGSRVAELCNAFGMTVIAHDPFLTPNQVTERGAKPVNLPELLAVSDVVTVHCPRTASTLGMFDNSLFAQMKFTSFFVNTARGGIHVEQDLYEALVNKCIAGAGVDVFLDEPPPRSHPLLSLDTVIATPHSAGLSREAVRSMAAYAATQWIEIFEGRVPSRLVNPEAWPKYSMRFRALMGFSPDELA